jgi:hypothetical protein
MEASGAAVKTKARKAAFSRRRFRKRFLHPTHGGETEPDPGIRLRLERDREITNYPIQTDAGFRID